MKICADENIPLVNYYFADHELLLKPGRSINKNDLLDVDVLLVRSVTQVNEALLRGSAVKFVGSTTAGIDHLDVHWLNHVGIEWAFAAGCNATAVAEYVICVIASLQKKGLLLNDTLRAGIVGVGHVGKQVAEKLSILGFDVLLCDPLRKINEPHFSDHAINELSQLDFISLHTPLTYEGEYLTYRMIDFDFLSTLNKKTILLNAGRGEIINFSSLKKHTLTYIFDVWENEPHIDQAILKNALLATPHIAGYSIQSKYRGIEAIYKKLVQKNIIEDKKFSMQFPKITIDFENQPVDWRDVVLRIYDPEKTSVEMKKVLAEDENSFDQLRKNFPERYEFEYVRVVNAILSEKDKAILKNLKIEL